MAPDHPLNVRAQLINIFCFNYTASDGSAQVGPIVGGVVAVVLILAITGVIIAVIVMRGKRTQPE